MMTIKRKISSVLLSVFLIASLVVGIFAASPMVALAADTGSIEIKVKDAATDAPLGGVIYSIYSSEEDAKAGTGAIGTIGPTDDIKGTATSDYSSAEGGSTYYGRLSTVPNPYVLESSMYSGIIQLAVAPGETTSLEISLTRGFTVTYDANGASGTVPVDTKSPYLSGSNVTVLGTDGLSPGGSIFLCWLSGDTSYYHGDVFQITANTTLVAQWDPPIPSPTITTTSLPNGVVGMAYSQTLAATGTTPITWSVTSGSLPDGLALSTAGVISGTPTTAGVVSFTVTAANGTSPNATQSLSIKVDETPAITGADDVPLVRGYDAYTAPYTISGAPAPTVDVSGIAGVTIDQAGNLTIPEGLTLGTYTLTITATNSVDVARKTVTVKVSNPTGGNNHNVTTKPPVKIETPPGSDTTTPVSDVKLKIDGDFEKWVGVDINGAPMPGFVKPANTNEIKSITHNGKAAGVGINGSVDMTLYGSWLRTLPSGDYTVRIWFDDGYGETSFNISQRANPASPASVNSSGSARTADDMPLGLWITLAMIAGAGLTALVIIRRRSEKN